MMNVWALDKDQVYLLTGDDVVTDLMLQLRVPNHFQSIGPGPLEVFDAFDNHPTHWIIILLSKDQPDYSPNHAVHRLVKNADPNGLRLMAYPKSSTSKSQFLETLKTFGAKSTFEFSQFPQK